MQVSARIEMETFTEGRSQPRRRANLMASLRQRKLPKETIHILDISPMGCGFQSRWSFVQGTRVWLALPGLETWAATIVWYENGKGGLRFETPLHPAVAQRYEADLARSGN